MLSDQIVSGLQPKTGARQRIKPDHEKGEDPAKTCRGFGVKVKRAVARLTSSATISMAPSASS